MTDLERMALRAEMAEADRSDLTAKLAKAEAEVSRLTASIAALRDVYDPLTAEIRKALGEEAWSVPFGDPANR